MWDGGMIQGNKVGTSLDLRQTWEGDFLGWRNGFCKALILENG